MRTINKIMRHLLWSALLLFLSAAFAKSQPTINGNILYGFVHDDTGLLFIKTENHLYTIDGQSENYNAIRTEIDSIAPIAGTPYMYVITPELKILDLSQNKIVFSQSEKGFSRIHHINLVKELDAFFLVASKKSAQPQPTETEKDSNKKGKFGLKNSLNSLKKSLKGSFKSDSISFNLVDIVSGEVIWSYTPKEEQGKFFSTTSDRPVVLGSDRVVFPFGNNFYCLDAQLGTMLWKAPYKRASVGDGLLSIVNRQMPSRYFKNFANDLGLLVFENKKEKKKEREKTLSLIDFSGNQKWQLKMDKDENVGDFWENNALIYTSQKTKMIDLETGKNSWVEPYTSDRQYAAVSVHHSNEFLLAIEQWKTIKSFPLTIDVLDPETSESLWGQSKDFTSRKNRIKLRKNGIEVYEPEDKELVFYDYLTGKSVWNYSKKALNNYVNHDDEYFIATKSGVDRLNYQGRNLWGRTVPLMAQGFWEIKTEGENTLLITNKNSAKKNISLISSRGEVLMTQDWKISDEDSVFFTKKTGNDFLYIGKNGVFKMDLNTESKPEKLAKFSKRDKKLIYNNDSTKIVINSKGNFHYVDLETTDYKLLAQYLRFDGKSERMDVSFIEGEGVLVMNNENIAFMSYDSGLVFKEYYKYPKTSELGHILLRGAVGLGTFALQYSETVKFAEDASAFSLTGDVNYANQARTHNYNVAVIGAVGSVLQSKIRSLEQQRQNRKRLAARSKPVAVFAEKRKIDNRKAIVLVRVDPITGEELAVVEIGEKNPVFYVDQVGGLIYYINSLNKVERINI